MNKIIFTLLLMTSALSLTAQPGFPMTVLHTGNNQDNGAAQALADPQTGRLYLSGSTATGATYWPALTCVDACRNIVWSKIYDFENTETFQATFTQLFIADDGQLLISGFTNPNSFSSRLILAKINVNNGALIWYKTYRIDTRILNFNTFRSEGDPEGERYYVYANINFGNDHAVFFKFDADGQLYWTRQYNGGTDEQPGLAFSTLDGGFALGGDYGGYANDMMTCDYLGNVVHSKTIRHGLFPGGAVTNYSAFWWGVRTHTGGYFMAGSCLNEFSGEQIPIVSLLDSELNTLWVKRISGYESLFDYEIQPAVVRDRYNQYYVWLNRGAPASSELSVLKFDSDFQFMYAKVFAGEPLLLGKIAGNLNTEPERLLVSANTPPPGILGGYDMFTAVMDTSLNACGLEFYNVQLEPAIFQNAPFNPVPIPISFTEDVPPVTVLDLDFTATDFCNPSGAILVHRDTSLCAGQTLTLPGGQMVSTAGNYSDTLSSVGGCDSIIVTQLSILPALSIGTMADVTIQKGDTLTLSVLVSPASGSIAYMWTPAGSLSCSDCPAPLAQPIETTEYTLQVSQPGACPDTQQVKVFVLTCAADTSHLRLPNAFTPNADGVNDRFYPIGSLPCATIKLFRVFNRWGEMVFEKKDIAPNDPVAGWDGTAGGRQGESDVYVYYLILTMGEQEQMLRGEVTLLR